MAPSRKPLLALLTAVLAGLGAAPGAVEAQPVSCSAALNTTPVFCDGGDPPACDPLAFTNQMPVKLSVSVENDSLFGSGSGTNPPAANLRAGRTIKVLYSCSTASCLPAERLSGFFSYLGHTSGSGSSFSDDGNGVSGTITITDDSIGWLQGDQSLRQLVSIDLVANQPPGAGMLFARAGFTAEDQSDSILLITDPGCIDAGVITGGGQGSTSGSFAPAPTPTPTATPTVTATRTPQPTTPPTPTHTGPPGPPPPPPSVPTSSVPVLVLMALLLISLGLWPLRSRRDEPSGSQH